MSDHGRTDSYAGPDWKKYEAPQALLLVDHETGRVLSGGQRVTATRQFLEFHPYIAILHDAVFAGPDAQRRRTARRHGNGEARLDAVEYRIRRPDDVPLTLDLQQ